MLNIFSCTDLIRYLLSTFLNKLTEYLNCLQYDSRQNTDVILIAHHILHPLFIQIPPENSNCGLTLPLKITHAVTRESVWNGGRGAAAENVNIYFMLVFEYT